jgi:hypothetical protein
MLEDRIGYPLANLDARDYEGLVEYGKEKKALASETADQMAKRLEQEKAENGIRLEAETKKAKEKAQEALNAANNATTDDSFGRASGPATPAAVERVKVFADFVDQIRAASAVEALVQVGAAFGISKLPPADLKILQRQYGDRLLVLQDAAKHPPKARKLEIRDDVPL